MIGLRRDAIHVDLDVLGDQFMKDEVDGADGGFNVIGDLAAFAGVDRMNGLCDRSNFLDSRSFHRMIALLCIGDDEVATALTAFRTATRFLEIHSVPSIAVITAENDRHVRWLQRWPGGTLPTGYGSEMEQGMRECGYNNSPRPVTTMQVTTLSIEVADSLMAARARTRNPLRSIEVTGWRVELTLLQLRW